MQFEIPEFLWLAPLALAVAWWWAWRRRPAVRYSDASLFAGGRGGRAWRAAWGGAALRGLAFLAIVLACAGPRIPDLRTRIPANAIAVMAIIDVSNSMTTLVPWAVNQPAIQRLDAAKNAFKLFVLGGEAPDGTKFEPRPTDQIGLVRLAIVPFTACPLTLNHSSVLVKEVDALTIQGDIHAGTNIGDAIAEAVIRLDSSGGAKTKVIVLLSDGEHTQAKEALHRPREAAQLAANLKYRIYTIDCGGDPSLIADPKKRGDREIGRQTLKDVAAMTEGRYFDAADGPGMLAAFKEIDSLERVVVEAPQYRRYFEYYWWCAAFAFVLILVAHLLDRTRWRTVP
jgi:Ca-activated chloride channel family protein